MFRRPSLAGDERAVTENIDTILMVGVTLIAAGALVVLISSMGGPAERVNADLQMTLDPGADDWESGDEVLTVKHIGGEALKAEDVVFRVQIGDQSFLYDAASLGFSGGTFSFGDTWTRTYTVPLGSTVGLDVIAKTYGETSQNAAGISGANVVGGSYLEEMVFAGSLTAIGAAPDLEITILRTDPPVPYTGGPDMTIVAEIVNLGNRATPAGTPIAVAFVVDGVPLSTHSITDPIGIGQSVQVTSDAWAILPYDPVDPWAQVGIYLATATVDPADAIIELSEANNVDTHLFQVAKGIYDPGHAYEDLNNDGLFTPGFDTALINGEVQDGHHRAPDGAGLVIPPSVGPIGGVNLYQVSGDSDIIIAVNLTATTGQIHVKTSEGSVTMDGITVTTGGSIKVEMTQSTDGTDGISIVGSLFQAGTYIDIDSKDGWVMLTDSTIEAGDQDLTVLAADGDLEADDAILRSDRGILLEAEGHISIQRSTLQAGTTLEADLFQVAGRTLYVAGATLDDPDDTLHVAPDGVGVVGTPASGTTSY